MFKDNGASVDNPIPQESQESGSSNIQGPTFTDRFRAMKKYMYEHREGVAAAVILSVIGTVAAVTLAGQIVADRPTSPLGSSHAATQEGSQDNLIQGCTGTEVAEDQPMVNLDTRLYIEIAEKLLQANDTYKDNFLFIKKMDSFGQTVGKLQPRETGRNMLTSSKPISIVQWPNPLPDPDNPSFAMEEPIGTIQLNDRGQDNKSYELFSFADLEVLDRATGTAIIFALSNYKISEIPDCQGKPNAVNVIEVNGKIYQVQPTYVPIGYKLANGNKVMFVREKYLLPQDPSFQP